MRHFKLPILVTVVAFVLVMAIGIGGTIWITQSAGSNREKETRAQMLGSGSAMLLGVIVAPFWFYAAAKVGKERRAAKKAPVRQTVGTARGSSPSLPPRRG
jgi:hypothetical protein